MKLSTLTPALVAIASLLAAHARADEMFSRATLLVPSCAMDGVSDPNLRAAAALELQAQGIGLAPVGVLSASDALVRIESSCAAGSEVIVRASWAGQERVRTLNLGELPPRTRARALALSLAELLGSFKKGVEPEAVELPETEADAEPKPPASEPKPAEPSDPTAPPPAPAAAASPATAPPKAGPRIQWTTGQMPADTSPKPSSAKRDVDLGLSAEARVFSSSDMVSGIRPHLDSSTVSVGVSIVGGSASADSGTVSALILHGVCSLRLLESPADDGVSFGLGPRFGVGLIRMAGEPFSGSGGVETIDLYLDGGATGTLELRPASWLRFGLGLEVGYALGAIAVDDTQQIAEFAGLFLGGLADLSLAL